LSSPIDANRKSSNSEPSDDTEPERFISITEWGRPYRTYSADIEIALRLSRLVTSKLPGWPGTSISAESLPPDRTPRRRRSSDVLRLVSSCGCGASPGSLARASAVLRASLMRASFFGSSAIPIASPGAQRRRYETRREPSTRA
jgi:hypothetical protein